MKNKIIYQYFLIGDCIGAPWEGTIPMQIVWFLIGRKNGKKRWTDDTQMTLDVIKHLDKNKTINQDQLAVEFCDSFKWHLGYGKTTCHTIHNIKKGMHWNNANEYPYKEGSKGNGAAMRVLPLALAFTNRERLITETKKCSEITHKHPQGVEGAVFTSLSYHYAIQNKPIIQSLETHQWSEEFTNRINKIKNNPNKGYKWIRRNLGNKELAIDTASTALYLAIQYKKECYTNIIKNIKKIKGDTDTTLAISLAMWACMQTKLKTPPELKKCNVPSKLN